MAKPLQLNIGNLPSVASGQKPQLSILQPGRIFSLALEFTAAGVPLTDLQLANDVQLIRVIGNGSEIHSISGQDLIIYWNRQYGNYAHAGENCFMNPQPSGTLIVPFGFSDPSYASYVNETALSLGTRNLKSLTLEVTFNSGAITATQCAVSVFSDDVIADLNQYFSFTTFPQSLVAGVNDIQQLPKEDDVGVLQYMIVNTNQGGVSLDLFDILMGSQSLQQMTRNTALARESMLKKSAQVPVIGSGAALTNLEAHFLEFNPSGDLATWLPLKGQNDQRIRLTYTGAPGSVGIVRASIRGLK